MTRSPLLVRMTGSVVRSLTRAIERLGRERALRVARFLVKVIAPLVPETRTARRNIALAFPEKSAAERRAILNGTWDNLARLLVEFVFLEEIAKFDVAHREANYFTLEGGEFFDALRDDGKPAVIFGAHLANWEMVAVAGEAFGMRSVLPFRAPIHSTIAADILEKRQRLMGHLVRNSRGATFEIAAALQAGEHLGMMIDQRLASGIRVPFFGRPARTNPILASFARQFDCPVHGARAIRMPDGRLHLEMTPPIDLPRDAEGLIDVAAATAVITKIVEGWVREHPEQWFWLHDRWK
jgi:KDO2-lipid IV(A) lauroyltransferase